MKALSISFGVVLLLVLVAVLFKPEPIEPIDLQMHSPAEPSRKPELEQITPAVTTAPHAPSIEQTVAQQMEIILTDAHVASEQYLLLVKLLGSNENEVLAYLAQLRYPEELSVTSAEYEQVEMISRAMLEFYGSKPLGENLDKVEQLRETGPLFSNVVSDLFLCGADVESAGVAYDWVMQNPDHPASLRSGATIGTMLNDYTPEQAWTKAVDLPEGDIRARAFTAILTNSSGGDINTAIDLINSVDTTADLDGAISTVLSMGIDNGYEFAELVDLAAAPVDPVYRSSTLVMLFQNWAMQNPDSLQEWSTQEHAFPEAQQAEIDLVVKQTLQRLQVQY
ncbi:hypothetical protein [Coraliomargarita akajimensis]|uniref:PBS lyase HEAT domain protein repeat-containing protein n=1 Tax=Coraliomargarita akajimensis (strain DSM 45221 / IAM 15411 / JCM 23193 / KCTC 12865 / 04OKA010-24) TaxID=583355 RepID=D5ENZ3_CORAD|nr:hypothetical protein [Coraliomargarita akajimensis]ADE53652.1 hypothetical protein Caka_0627 [Coraliomargarita akajimensis DSM 45221]